MSMVLVVMAATDATVGRVVADPPLIFQYLAPDDLSEYKQARAKSRSFLSRILGRDSDVAPLQLIEGEGPLVDIEKAWHGIHFLLTGSAEGGSPPLNFLLGGGQEVKGQEVGYGTARAFTADESARISEALDAVSEVDLRGRYDADAFKRADIYPDIWVPVTDDSEPLDYLLENFDTLRAGFRTLKKENWGCFIFLT